MVSLSPPRATRKTTQQLRELIRRSGKHEGRERRKQGVTVIDSSVEESPRGQVSGVNRLKKFCNRRERWGVVGG